MDGGRALKRIGEDPDSFEAFYRQHVGTVWRLVARRVADPNLAADLIAEVFLAAIDSAAAPNASRGTPRAWLHRLVLTVVGLDRARRAAEQRTRDRILARQLLRDDDIGHLAEGIAAEAPARILVEGAAGLPKRSRPVYELVVVGGLPIHEVARAMGLASIAARLRLFRALTALGTPEPISQAIAVGGRSGDSKRSGFEERLLTELLAVVSRRAERSSKQGAN